MRYKVVTNPNQTLATNLEQLFSSSFVHLYISYHISDIVLISAMFLKMVAVATITVGTRGKHRKTNKGQMLPSNKKT